MLDRVDAGTKHGAVNVKGGYGNDRSSHSSQDGR